MTLRFVYLALIVFSSAPQASTRDPDSLYDILLSRHLDNGLVDYSHLCADARLHTYVEALSMEDSDRRMSRNEQLAYWINLYNAWTLQIVCTHYPVESIVDIGFGGLILGHLLGTTVWDRELVSVNGTSMTLNSIEHDIIRRVFRDPRVHFALVCAAMSCPPLRREPYRGATIDEQLDDQGRIFLNDPRRNRFDRSARVAHLSKIFDWYGDDFGEDDSDILRFVARYLPGPLAADIEEYAGTWRVKYLPYDWSLNDARSVLQSASPEHPVTLPETDTLSVR